DHRVVMAGGAHAQLLQGGGADGGEGAGGNLGPVGVQRADARVEEGVVFPQGPVGQDAVDHRLQGRGNSRRGAARVAGDGGADGRERGGGHLLPLVVEGGRQRVEIGG